MHVHVHTQTFIFLSATTVFNMLFFWLTQRTISFRARLQHFRGCIYSKDTAKQIAPAVTNSFTNWSLNTVDRYSTEFDQESQQK